MDRTECGTIDADPPLIRHRLWKIAPDIRLHAVATGNPVKRSRESFPSASPAPAERHVLRGEGERHQNAFPILPPTKTV